MPRGHAPAPNAASLGRAAAPKAAAGQQSCSIVKCKRNIREEDLRRQVQEVTGDALEVDLKELAESQCDELVPVLGEAIAAHTSLECLTVTAFDLSEEAGQSLVETVTRSPALKLFVLRADYLAKDTVLALAEAVAHGAGLEGLTISGNFPEDDVGEAFGEALSTNSTLKAFVLEGELVGDEIGTAIATALREGSLLRELSINGDLLGDSTCSALAESLGSNAVLESLKLGGAAISDAGGQALADALRSNAGLVLLELTGHCIGDETGRAFAEALRVNRTLRSLAVRAMRGSSWAVSGCCALAEALMTNSTLQVLEVVSGGPGDAEVLAEMLRRNRSLRCLTVRGSVRDSGCTALAAALQSNRSLAALNVHDSSLTKASGKAMQIALRCNASLMWSTITLKSWPTASAAAAMERNRDLPRCWRDLALVARKSGLEAVSAAVAAMTERGFRCSVFAFLLPRRAMLGRNDVQAED